MVSRIDPSDGWPGFDTPEEAALDGWRPYPAARAHVVSVEPSPNADGAVWVTVQLDGHPGHHDQDINNCVQAPDGRWSATSSFPA